ncbi:MAG: hypothetical protein IPL46_34355 [Saprospiraceae bacterium]|nr:hypothetical protein [Saprospiraceae bacterium]
MTPLLQARKYADLPDTLINIDQSALSIFEAMAISNESSPARAKFFYFCGAF